MNKAIARHDAKHDRYLELIQAFSLRPIRNRAEYDKAAAVLDELVLRGEAALETGERDYLEMLEMLISTYDDVHFKLEMAHRTPLQRLKYLMKESGMKTADIGRLLGNRGLASLIVTGKRDLSKAHIRLLANHFRLDAGYFL